MTDCYIDLRYKYHLSTCYIFIYTHSIKGYSAACGMKC